MAWPTTLSAEEETDGQMSIASRIRDGFTYPCSDSDAGIGVIVVKDGNLSVAQHIASVLGLSTDDNDKEKPCDLVIPYLIKLDNLTKSTCQKCPDKHCVCLSRN